MEEEKQEKVVREGFFGLQPEQRGESSHVMTWERPGKGAGEPRKRPCEENEWSELGRASGEVSVSCLYSEETGAPGGGAPVWTSVSLCHFSWSGLRIHTLTHARVHVHAHTHTDTHRQQTHMSLGSTREARVSVLHTDHNRTYKKRQTDS